VKITNVVFKPIILSLKQPFKIALGTSFEYHGVILRIETDKGLIGLGEASPSARIVGETTASVVELLKNKVKPILLGKNPFEIERILDEVNSAILNNPSAKCAVDIALHDLLGKQAGLPLKNLLGGFRDGIVTSITVGIESIEKTIAEARKLIEDGAKVIKLKIGLEPEKDIERIRVLREEIGSETRIRVDANQGYTLTDAVRVLNKIESYDIEFVEQPLSYWDLSGARRLRTKVDLPIMADESLHSAHDAINLIREEACDMFNIKLMKSGGIREAMKIASIAEGSGIPCMIGGMIETKIGVGAATHLALGMKNIQYADLDAHLFLKKDIVKGGVMTKDGISSVTPKEGLGVELTSPVF
jgi:o-succinylbenzoate synthase